MRRNLALLLAVALAACAKPDTSNQPLKASLRLGWIPSGSFAGEAAGAARYAADNQLQLIIRPGGPSLNTVTLVASGEDTFGTLAADEVLLANESGADLVIVGVINDISPGGFVALKSSGIQKPSDFAGKRVGMLPFGSTTLLYESMMDVNNVDRSTIKEITISPDLRTFLEGGYDVHPVFVYDETVTLDQQGVGYTLIEPKDYGVTFKGPVYFTRREVVEKQPELVKAFVKTMIQGWTFALVNRSQAIHELKVLAPEVDSTRERAVLEKGSPYFKGYKGRPLSSDPASWEQMLQALVSSGKLKSRPDLTRVLRLDWVVGDSVLSGE